MSIFRRKPPLPVVPRRWFRDSDGTYYRNCPVIAAERDAVLEWPDSTPGKFALLESLSAEHDRVLSDEAERKASLEPGDVEAEPAPFREAYPRNPGLWVLDELGPGR